MQSIFEFIAKNIQKTSSLNNVDKNKVLLNFGNFKDDLKWNLKLLSAIVIGTVSFNAIWYLGTAVDVLGGHM